MKISGACPIGIKNLKLKIGGFFAFTYLLLATPVLAANAQPEEIGTINKEDPSWSEEIIIKRKATERDDGTLSLPGGSITVGPQANQLQFPDLKEINDAATHSLPFLLPEGLKRELEASPPEERTLTGKIFHPVCDVRVNGQTREAEGVPSTGSSEVTTPPWWSHLVGITKLSQAINIPGANSSASFKSIPVPELNDSEQNAAGDCGVALGETNGKTEPSGAQGATIINIGNIFKEILGWITGILSPGEPVDVEIAIKAKKFIPGESEFASQTSDKLGFLRSYCPQGLCPDINKISEMETTPYLDEEGDGSKDLEYQGVAGARKGYDLLVESLYPEGVEIQRGIPNEPNLPSASGAGIFKLTGNPASARLETIIRDAAKAFEVPAEVLAAIAWIEGGHMWNFKDSDIAAYTAPGAQDPIHCEPNGCQARGPMQFVNGGIATDCGVYTGTVMPDIWTPYSNAVNEATRGSREPHICNILDSLYAGSKKLKQTSGSTSSNWTKVEVYEAARAYYGSCTSSIPRLGDRTYCEFVWENYN